jgi:hypothetical protein
VPEIVPVVAFNDKPVGSAPAEIDQVSGVVPPVTVAVAEYGVPLTALGSVPPETTRAAPTCSVTCCEAVRGGAAESVTDTVKVKEPSVVGVPEITPVVELSDKPAGKDPPVIAHVVAPTAPFAVSVAE